MASRSCCGTNAPWWTPAGPCVSQGSAVIIFIPLISQIEMDTYDKNVTATPHVGGLTGLHVTFECLALLSFAANGHVIAHRNFKVIYGKSLVAVYGL